MAYVGYVFTRSDVAHEHILRPERLFVGGDTRYGLGWLCRDSIEDASTLFGAKVERSGDFPSISAGRVLAHADPQGNGIEMTGDREGVTGRDRSKIRRHAQLLWVPGSSGRESLTWGLTEEGVWRPV